MSVIGIIVLLVLIVVGFQALAAVLGLTIGLIIALLPAMFAGYLAGHIISGAGYGAVANVLLGLGGGIVGNILLNLLNIEVGDGWVERIAVGVVGAMCLVWLGRITGVRRKAQGLLSGLALQAFQSTNTASQAVGVCALLLRAASAFLQTMQCDKRSRVRPVVRFSGRATTPCATVCILAGICDSQG